MCPVITLSATAFPGGAIGSTYPPTTLTQTGGVGAVTFLLTGGALPNGMSLSSAGTVSGTPTQTGTFNFTVTATDANGCTGSRPYSLTISANTPPTISVIGTATTGRNTPVTVSFTVADVETGAAIVTVSGTSTNQMLVPNANLVFGGSGANRTLTITPVNSQIGSTMITVTASDGGLSSDSSFTLNVPANTEPRVNGPGNVITGRNTPITLSFTVADSETAPSALMVTATSSNQTVVPNANVVMMGSDGDRTVTLTPAAGQWGATTIAIAASDGTFTTNFSFVLVVYLGVVADLNHDARADLLWRHRTTGEDMGFLMNGTTVAESAFLATVSDTNWEIRGNGDLNGDGMADVTWRHRVNGQNVGWLMNGLTVATAASLPTIADTNWEITGVSDVNGDGKADVILRHRVTGQNVVWLMDGLSIVFAAFLPTMADTNWEIRGLGDVDADNRADVLWRDRSTGQNLVWLMNGASATSVPLPTIADTNWALVGSADLNGDGRADILWRHSVSGQNVGWLMNGATVAAAAFLPTIADTNWEIKSVGDLDADGRADVVWRNRATGDNIAWLMNGLTMRIAVFLPSVADTNWEIVGRN